MSAGNLRYNWPINVMLFFGLGLVALIVLKAYRDVAEFHKHILSKKDLWETV